MKFCSNKIYRNQIIHQQMNYITKFAYILKNELIIRFFLQLKLETIKGETLNYNIS